MREVPPGARRRGSPVRFLGPLATGAGAIAIAVLLTGASAAAAGTAGRTVKAPYKHAEVVPYNNQYTNGCGKLDTPKKWTFSSRTGIGRVASGGRAFQCANPQYGSTSSEVYDTGDTEVEIPFHVAPSATTLEANASAAWSAYVAASDGGTPLCGDSYDYDDTSVTSEWGYSAASGSFTSNNYSYWDGQRQPWNAIWHNGTGGTGAPPSPFHENRTSSFAWYHAWGGSATCSSYAGAYVYADAYVVDESNGTYIPEAAGSPYYFELFNLFVESYNMTSWSCTNSTDWDGPSATWSNGTLSCTSYNATITSYWYDNLPPYSSGSGANNSVTLSNASSARVTWTWNYSFDAAHHFELFLSFFGVLYAADSWPSPGSAAYDVNLATAGNGLKLVSLWSG